MQFFLQFLIISLPGKRRLRLLSKLLRSAVLSSASHLYGRVKTSLKGGAKDGRSFVGRRRKVD